MFNFRSDTKGFVDKVKKLLKGHIDLLMRFNIFLPKGYKIVECENSPMEDEPAPYSMEERSKEDEQDLKRILCDITHLVI